MAREHILLIEHDPFVAATIELMLESSGFRVITVHDRSSAFEILKTRRPAIDAVVLTATLDCGGPPYLAERIGDLGLPLVMISGNDQAMNEAADLGLQLLHKPFGREDLHAEVMFALSTGVAGWRQASCTAFDQQDAKIAGPADQRSDTSESAVARRWRMQADELRAAADQMKTPRAQQSLRRLADSYEALADRDNPRSKPREDIG